MCDNTIIHNMAAEKAQDMDEVIVTMNAWEYRAKWYGEDEKMANSRERKLEGNGDTPARTRPQTNVKTGRYGIFPCPITLVLASQESETAAQPAIQLMEKNL